MKRLLILAGLAGMAVWTGVGIFAWSRLAFEGEAERARQALDERDALALAALADEVETLHADVRALAEGFGQSLQALHDELAARADEHAAELRDELAAMREEVGARNDRSPGDPREIADLLRELGRRSDDPGAAGAPEASGPAGSAVLEPSEAATAAVTEREPAGEAEPAAAETDTVASSAAAPVPRRSFLAFQLPSDDFRFDERRTWTVLPALSRVGFDAKTTLHDFSAVTSAVAGGLECVLAQPGERPSARVVVEAAKLDSGDAARDEDMRERLAVEEHETLEFALTGFEARTVDPGDLRVQGTARGTLTIRGVAREVAMPVELAVDDARRLSVEGEATIDLETFGVPVPSKLGLITMEKEVKIWLSLKLRAEPRLPRSK